MTKTEETIEDRLKRLEQAEFERDLAKSRLAVAQKYIEQRDDVSNSGAAQAHILHQEGIILRQRMALRDLGESCYRKKKANAKLREQVAGLKRALSRKGIPHADIASFAPKVAHSG